MKGYLYKELRQNRLFLILTAILAVCVIFLPIILIMISEKVIGREVFLIFAQSGIILRVLISVLGFIGAYAIQSFTLKGDDKKLWGYFVASNPKGIKGFIFTKYAFIFSLGLIYFSLCAGCDLILVFITRFIGGAIIPHMSGIYFEFFFFQILCCALDIPFTLRFGEKMGNNIKITILTVLAIISIIVIVFNPTGLADKGADFLLNGEIPSFIKWICPVVSIIGYVISYLISCKLYIKGVDKYYK